MDFSVVPGFSWVPHLRPDLWAKVGSFVIRQVRSFLVAFSQISNFKSEISGRRV
jgi:hypothetical protein